MQFTADQVWACAVAADRINGGYIKEPVYDFNVDQRNPVKQANKAIVKQWLRESTFAAVTEEDHVKGREIRNYFNGLTLKVLSGKITDFERTALKIAQKDEFTGRDMLDFAVVSCLPEAARRNQQRSDEKREIYHSEQLQGAEGDTIVGDITVVRSRFNPEYNRYKIYARMGESFVDFWFPRAVEGELRIKGKIKALRGDKTTALNYVKITG